MRGFWISVRAEEIRAEEILLQEGPKRNTVKLKSKYLYLTIDLLTISVPFLASFYSKAPFYKKWKYLSVAILIPALLFILWDEFFTRIGVWGFNPYYLSGIYVGSLPIEEILFFICIPYSCVFIYFALNHLVKKDLFYFQQDIISSVLAVGLIVVGAFSMNKAYTASTFILCGVFIAFHLLKLRSRYISRFYFAFLVVLIPFFIVNGILTGSFIPGEVVWYNNDENLNMRIGTVPVEDIFYGMLLILLNVTIFEWLQRKSSPENKKGYFHNPFKYR
jgi:lycopene cyclase domain-containing protein